MWITYPGDFEIWYGNIFNNRRTERGAMFPPFWRQYSHYVTVEFSREYDLEGDEEITINTEGSFNLMLDGKLQFGQPETFIVPAGKHKLNLKVWNQQTPPALHITSSRRDGSGPGSINTDSSWMATYEDKIWIDENGIAHGSGIYVPAATSVYFQTKEQKPSLFKLSTTPQQPVATEHVGKGILYDFGRETMGLLVVDNARDKGLIEVYYGESREEALDKEHCETLDKFTVNEFYPKVLDSKAFRFVYVEAEKDVEALTVYMFYEYSEHDEDKSGYFECDDEELNKIWQVGAYTMDLTTREFFMDGIKRDRWTWSGDAIQSYLMNYYLRFDSECVKRTIRQLRGKDPVTSHVNTILDYTFYWFNSVLDYYNYTGDADFVREIFPRMLTMMDYVLGRLCKKDGKDLWAIGQSDDWIFVDWVDFPMHKRGVLCFEQILFAKSLETMNICKNIVGELSDLQLTNLHLTHLSEDGSLPDYGMMAEQLRAEIDKTFWNEDKHGYMHALEPMENMGEMELNADITKFPNMFQIIYGYADEKRQEDIMEHVMLNPQVEAITTPYMRFYELEALCRMGLQERVLGEIKDYWGGMLKEGATSFWEKYVPTEKGAEHLQMYGRPYGKSLCHAWGASPVYLLGKYFLGISPVKPGYAEWECRPSLGGLKWMKGKVPTPFGPIALEINNEQITIKSPIPNGRLYINDKVIEINTTEMVVKL